MKITNFLSSHFSEWFDISSR